jgi:hypothetical protein
MARERGFRTRKGTIEFIDVHPVIRPIAEYKEFLKTLQGGWA